MITFLHKNVTQAVDGGSEPFVDPTPVGVPLVLMTDPEHRSSSEPPLLEALQCSFCGKRGTEVERLIAGPTPQIAICNECIELCSEILAEEREGRSGTAHAD